MPEPRAFPVVRGVPEVTTAPRFASARISRSIPAGHPPAERRAACGQKRLDHTPLKAAQIKTRRGKSSMAVIEPDSSKFVNP